MVPLRRSRTAPRNIRGCASTSTRTSGVSSCATTGAAWRPSRWPASAGGGTPLGARAYVLAAGGIENVRLLLGSSDVAPAGIGNHADWLGRGFQGHTTIVGSDPVLWLNRTDEDLDPYNNRLTDRPHLVLGASDAAQRGERGLNFTTTLAGPIAEPAAAARAIGAVGTHLSGTPASAHRAIYFMVEHPPNRDSRITVDAGDRDPIGMPRVRLDMRHAEVEHEWLTRSVSALARELGRLGAGRLRWTGERADWLDSLSSLSRHHMGATRMSASPSEGVVDEHGRIHGVPNLFVAGSSVFPTSGIANPTLTLLALVLRLGDRLIAANGGAA
jgi:choline dehydrogenase-like flavoprotein